MKQNAFIAYIIGDQLAELSGISARAMFGGYGIYNEGTIVGIVIDESLYLKVDESNKAEYEAMGSAPFQYSKKDGKAVSMSYWSVPPEVVEDRERLVELVLLSYEINLTKAMSKKPSKKRPKKSGRPKAKRP